MQLDLKIKNSNKNHKIEDLVEEIISIKEAVLGKGSTIIVSTGNHTGRSQEDKYIVFQNKLKKEIWWKNNKKRQKRIFKNFSQIFLNMQNQNKPCLIYIRCSNQKINFLH